MLEPVELENSNPGIRPPNSPHTPIDLHKVARFRPHIQKTGGFFVSKLKKLHAVEAEKREKTHKLLPQNQFKLDISKQLQHRISTHLTGIYGIEIDPSRHFFLATKETVYLTSPAFLEIQQHLQCEKVGIPVFKKDGERLRPTHHLGNMLGDTATKHVVTLTDEQIQEYSQGNSLPLADLQIPS